MENIEAPPAPVFTPLSIAPNDPSQRPWLEEMENNSTNQVDKTGYRFQRESLPPIIDTADVASPTGIETLAVEPHLAPLRAKALPAIAAIEKDPDLDRGSKSRKLAALQAVRAEAVKDLPGKIEAAIKTFETQNAPPSAAITPELLNVLTGINHAVTHWLAEDVLTTLEHTGPGNPSTLDAVRATLRRLDQAPPKTWDEKSRSKPLELLMTLPRGKGEVAAERYQRAKEIIDATRTEWRNRVTQFVATGK